MNEEWYSMRQMVRLIAVDTESPIFGYSVNKLVPQLKDAGRYVSSADTLYRKLRIYNKANILPAKGDDGITVGAPSLVHESNFPV